jgi:hypothetical protein
MSTDELKAGSPAAGGCPHCDAGNVARFRTDTREWVHDFVGRASVSHTICQKRR